MMKLIELHTALQQSPPPGALSRLEEPFVNQTAIEMLTKIVGLPLIAIDLAPSTFAERFPNPEIPAAAQQVFGNDVKRYRVWRRLVLDSLMLATLKQVDPNPWDSLRRITRLTVGEHVARQLAPIPAALPVGAAPWQVTRALAINAEAQVVDRRRQALRSGFAVFDRLQDEDLIVVTGLLPDAIIGHLPRPTAHTTHAPLPAKLQTYFDTTTARARAALPFVWRIACLSGLFEPGKDPHPEDLLEPQMLQRLQILDPAGFGFDRPTQKGYLTYLRNLRNDLSPANTQPIRTASDPVSDAWAALRTAFRRTGVPKNQLNYLSHVATPACADGLSPIDLTPAWFQRTFELLPAIKCAPFRSGCYFMDAQRANPEAPHGLMPLEATGIERQRAAPGKAKPKTTETRPKRPVSDDPVEMSWIGLFVGARSVGATENRLSSLYKIRSPAVACRLSPSMLTTAWVEKLRDELKLHASAIGTAARLLDDLRVHPNLKHQLPEHPIGTLTDRRRSSGKLPLRIANDLAQLNAFRGIGQSGCRAAQIAVAALIDVVGIDGHTETSLDELMVRDFSSVDWAQHSTQAERYIKTLTQLKSFLDLPWTPAWRALQRAIVASGVTTRDNPVPALLVRAEGRDPHALTRAWARETDRWLRAPNSLSHHGRTDLAKTLARNIARLDRLHDIPEISATGLLPAIIGQVRD